MDFNDTPEQASFRADVRQWLEANATLRKDKLYKGMEGDDAFKEAKAWYKKLPTLAMPVSLGQKSMAVQVYLRKKKNC